MEQDLEWIINWVPLLRITVMQDMFFKDTLHSHVSWEMMEDLDGTEPCPAVMVRTGFHLFSLPLSLLFLCNREETGEKLEIILIILSFRKNPFQ